jgi:hypothetical protein
MDYALSYKTWEDWKLISAEKIGSAVRRQYCPVAARANQEMQPAIWQVRIVLAGKHYDSL